MFETLSSVFGSKTKAQEILILLNDGKEVVRQGFYEEELSKVESFCKQNNLCLVKSKFKILLDDEVVSVIGKNKLNNYSNKGIRIPEKDSRKGMFFVYISKDEEKALLAAYYEQINDDYQLGLSLGYPKCCVEFFCQKFNSKNYNLELKPTNHFTNLSKRNRDAVIISHFPCNSDCEKSVQLGKKYLEIILNNALDRGKELLEELRV